MPTQLTFSNNIESLAEEFALQVSAQHDPFDPSMIIIPNPYLKKWLQLKIAERNGIALNFNFQFLNDGLWSVISSLIPAAAPEKMEQGDLHFMLYHSLTALEGGARRVKPLVEYLSGIENLRGMDYDTRAWQLSSRLARYFLEYELYREDMTKAWLAGKCLYNTEMEAAQQHLYFSVFKKGGYRDALNPNLLTLPQHWGNAAARVSAAKTRRVYLFGKTQLSPFHVRLIFELSRLLEINIYQMNPCSEFWEDVTTPGEDRWSRVRSIAIQSNREGDVLTERDDENPLLKQWGKTGRESVKLLSLLEEAGSMELAFVSRWIFPEHSSAPRTCLEAVQQGILKRTAGAVSKKMAQDASVQVTSCTDIFREAEAVYDSILYNLHSDPNLKMTDIAVMVPDMGAYGPVIESVFSRFPKRIAFSRIDSAPATESIFGKAVCKLLDLAIGSFTLKEVFELINNQCFLAACSMTSDDAAIWLSWANALNMFRGFSREDAVDPERNPHTWRQGLERLRLGRIMQTADLGLQDGNFLDYKHIVPYADMDTNDQRRINAFNLVIELLYRSVKDLSSLQTSGLEWTGIIENLIGRFIAVPTERTEEKRVARELFSSVKKLKMLDLLNEDGSEGSLSFYFIREFIIENLTEISGVGGAGYLTTGVNISALVPKRQIPFKITYILGMQEGLFPGGSDSSTLNLMNISRRIGDVTKPDVNRYLFFETLLGTEKKLYITYVAKDLQKDQDFHPNSIVGQLMTYVSRHVTSEEFKIVKVPASGTSLEYLMAEGQLGYADIVACNLNGKYQPTNFSESYRLAIFREASGYFVLDPSAKAAITRRLNETIPPIQVPQAQSARLEKTVSISVRDLTGYLINPIESTLRWHLHIRDNGGGGSADQVDEPFFSGYRYAGRFISDALAHFIMSGSRISLNRYIDDYYAHSRLMSRTPQGAFAKIDLDDIRDAIMERVSGGGGLSDFIESKKNCAFYQNVAFGSVMRAAKPGLAFPPARCPVKTKDQELTADLSGLFPFLWLNKDTGQFETMVITHSAKPTILPVINPFLSFVISLSGYEKDLQHFLGSTGFTINVSYKKGIESYRYHLDQLECKDYLDRLLCGFLDDSGFDFIPAQIVSDTRLPSPPVMNARPDESDRDEYRRDLARLISDDGDKRLPAIRVMDFIGILDVEVPFDAYDKVRDRFGILLKPFIQGEDQE